MKVDRQKFLLIVSAIASGCSGSRSPEPESVAAPVVVGTRAPDDGPVMVEPAEPEPDAVDGPEREPEPVSPIEEGVGPVYFSSAGSCRATNVAAPRAGSCNDDVGNPGNCQAVRLPGGCSSFGFICDKCESYKKHFKPGVAERAVRCVTAQKSDTLQDGCETYRCGDMALQSACPDPAAQTECQTIAKQCGVPMFECTRLLSGMNRAGRAAVAACVAGGCSYGIWSCIEGM